VDEAHSGGITEALVRRPFRPSRDADQRRPDGDCLTWLRVQHVDDPGEWNRYLDGGLRGLDLDDNLIDLDPITDLDVPSHDLSLGETFPQIW
jgi:hypothetical protein